MVVVDVHGIRKESIPSKVQPLPKSRETTNITVAQPSSLTEF